MTWNREYYPGLYTWSLKSIEFSPDGGRRGSQRCMKQKKYSICHHWLADGGRHLQRMWSTFRSWEWSLTEIRKKKRKLNPNPITTRIWIWPTTWMSLQVVSSPDPPVKSLAQANLDLWDPDAEAETPILWLPHAKSWLIGKDPDAGRDWGQEEKGTTEDEMAGWCHRLDGHEFE